MILRKLEGLLARVQSLEQQRTVVKSIRIDRELHSSLERIAHGRGLTLNALTSLILTKFVEWDNYADKYGFVTLPEELFRELLNTGSTEEIEELGKRLGPSLMKDLLQFWFKRADRKTFFEHIELMSKYGGLSNCKIENDDHDWVLTYRHQLGERWSRFVAAYYGETLRQMLGVEPKPDMSKTQVVLRWSFNPIQADA